MHDFQRTFHKGITALLLGTVFCAVYGTNAYVLAETRSSFSDFLKKTGLSQKSLDDTKIGQGLKEALRVGITRAVEITSRKDGYYANQKIRIPMPEKLQKAELLLRKAGMGSKIDEFVLSMNRAAEKAAPQARDIFINALGQMSIEDAQQLFKGSDTAATEYFKTNTKAPLLKAYGPVVSGAMQEYGVTRAYQQMTGKFQAVPGVGALLKSFEVEPYVVNKALEGMYSVLGEQEQAIRKDPAARVTTLLKEVFGVRPET